MVKTEYSAKLYLSISKWISHNNWQKKNIKKEKHLQSFTRIATNCARQCNVKKFILARIRCMIRFDIHSLEHQTNIGKLWNVYSVWNTKGGWERWRYEGMHIVKNNRIAYIELLTQHFEWCVSLMRHSFSLRLFRLSLTRFLFFISSDRVTNNNL